MTFLWDDSGCKTVCPHWSTAGRNCLLCRNGLFLPVADHVKTYCLTNNYTSCPQFIEALARGDGLCVSGNPVEQNRRRHDRIPARFSFRLSELLDEDALETLIDDSACTVDLSPGGIRFESPRSLSVDSQVKFFISSHGSDDSLGGTGRVRWCRSLDNAPLFHVGIAFADPVLAREICSRLSRHFV
ncbi:MAG TPA: PilZ domain-containing protein [Desulfobulbus sp.]|nr:PilZ domain-containing protein [Desulfobulbus sp.]